MSLPLPIVTERLILRPHRPDDVEPLREIYNHPSVLPHLLEKPWSDQIAQERVTARLAMTGLDSTEGALHLVIEREEHAIGNVTLRSNKARKSTAEAGWILAPQEWGHGYASEAVSRLLRRAFPAYELHWVFARMQPSNLASQRVAERVGMRREVHHVRDRWIMDGWADTLIYAVLRDELDARDPAKG